MMKQPVPKMTMLPEACTICDLWMRRGLIPRSHAGIKGFLMSFKAYGQNDLLSYRKKTRSSYDECCNGSNNHIRSTDHLRS